MTSYIYWGERLKHHHSDKYIIGNHVQEIQETEEAKAVKVWNVGVGWGCILEGCQGQLGERLTPLSKDLRMYGEWSVQD